MLWIANLVPNTGNWMQEVGAGWLMTSLSSSPAMVSLVQSALTLPILVLAIPAGVMADLIDRRKLLLFVLTWQIFCTLALAFLTWSGAVAAYTLLGFTFLIGLGPQFSYR